MKEIERKRIGNLEFCPATYICEKPENPSWAIDYIFPNELYQKQNEYTQIDGEWFYKDNPQIKHHISCFLSPESRYVLAFFDYKNGEYKLHKIRGRQSGLKKREKDAYKELIAYGEEVLNQKEEETSD